MNREQFDQLFRSTYPKLLTFARKHCLRIPEAEDAVMWAFEKVWRSKLLDNRKNPESYLFRAVSNCILDYRRSQTRRVVTLPLFVIRDEEDEPCLVSDLLTTSEPCTDALLIAKSDLDRVLQKAKEYDERFALAFEARLSGVFLRQALKTSKGRLSYNRYSKLFMRLQQEFEREK